MSDQTPITTPIETPIKTHADGSIDTAFYMAHGRETRSVAFLSLLGKLRRTRRRTPRPVSTARVFPAKAAVPAE